MIDFEPLELPEETDDGLWVVTVQSEEYRQLFHDGKIHDGNYWGDDDNWTTSLFCTEEGAFDCAKRYYHKYSVTYPNATALDGSLKLNDGSQVMNFGEKI